MPNLISYTHNSAPDRQNQPPHPKTNKKPQKKHKKRQKPQKSAIFCIFQGKAGHTTTFFAHHKGKTNLKHTVQNTKRAYKRIFKRLTANFNKQIKHNPHHNTQHPIPATHITPKKKHYTICAWHHKQQPKRHNVFMYTDIPMKNKHSDV